jgi:hypothetical protein
VTRREGGVRVKTHPHCRVFWGNDSVPPDFDPTNDILVRFIDPRQEEGREKGA